MDSVEKLRELLKCCGCSDECYSCRISYEGGKVIDAIEREISEKYMERPCDCEGVPIFIGDLLKSDETNEQLMCRGYSGTMRPGDGKWWTIECSYDSYSGTSEYVSAKSCHHVKPRTVEDVLNEFADLPERIDRIAAINRYADELREMLGSDD